MDVVFAVGKTNQKQSRLYVSINKGKYRKYTSKNTFDILTDACYFDIEKSATDKRLVQ